MPTTEIALSLGTLGKNPNRQGIPCFLGSHPMHAIDDLREADVAIIGIPFVSPLIGYENDVAPRKVRAAGQNYAGSYIPELDVDPAETLRILDYGDVDFPFGDTLAAMAAVEAAVGQAITAGCLPVTIGGNAPASSYAVAKAISERLEGSIGVINFDGHTDTMADYGDEPNSSNWVRAAYSQLGGFSPAHHLQIGLRGMNNRRQDMAFFRERGMRTVMAREVRELGSRQSGGGSGPPRRRRDRPYLARGRPRRPRSRRDAGVGLARSLRRCRQRHPGDRVRRRPERQALWHLADDDRRRYLLRAAARRLDHPLRSRRRR